MGCEPRTPATEPAEEPAAQVADDPDFQLDGDPEAGQEIYAIQCASCHGAQGGGDGAAAAALDPSPADFSQIELSAARVYRVTRNGGLAANLAATMPAFGTQLNEQQLHDVTAYVLQLGQ